MVGAHVTMAEGGDTERACAAAELVRSLWGYPIRTENDLHPAINRVGRAVLEAAIVRRRDQSAIR